MFNILYLGELLYHLMGFLIHVPQHFDANSSQNTSHLLHCMSLPRRTMVILGHFWLKFFNQVFWFSVESALSSGKRIFFRYFFLSKAWGLVKIHFLACFSPSVSRRKLKQSFTLGYGFGIAILPQTGGAGISGCFSGQKGREKTTICSLKLQKLNILTIMPKKITSVVRTVRNSLKPNNISDSKFQTVFSTTGQWQNLKIQWLLEATRNKNKRTRSWFYL